jgi:hypothetical protein
MLNWNKISLYKFQRLDEINNRDIPDMDKAFLSACIVFDFTEYEFDNLPLKKAMRYVSKVEKIIESDLELKLQKIGKFSMECDPSKLTFGQFIDLVFFLQSPMQNMHYVLASLASKDADTHKERAEYFLAQPIGKLMGCYKTFLDNFEAFQKEYKSLFGLDEDVAGEGASINKFNKRYGWIYSASMVAEYERITLDDAFALPIRRALNDLAYLKAKSKYESELLKKNNGR